MNETDNKETNKETCGCGGGSCCGGPGRWIWMVLVLAIVGVLIAKNARKKDVSVSAPATCCGLAAVETTAGKAVAPEIAAKKESLPRLVDLGSRGCVPCEMLVPILEDLKKTYAGRMNVAFIDVHETPDEAKKYGINLIPTQIFYSADGKELFRHEGFFSKEDILAKWKELGVDLAGK
jgi:thioredoxin 1